MMDTSASKYLFLLWTLFCNMDVRKSKSTLAIKQNETSKSSGFLNFITSKIYIILGTLVTLVFGMTARGDGILFIIYINRVLGLHLESYLPDAGQMSPSKSNHTSGIDSGYVQSYFTNIEYVLPISLLATFVTYYGLGGFLQYHYYYKQKDKPNEWKCQPNKWLTPSNERHEILMGSFNMVLGASVSSFIACYILNGGTMTLMYFDPWEKGAWYLFSSTIFLFFIHDAGAYYAHRACHLPIFYKRIHKHHHRYHSPTAFSATAMHPLEFSFFQSILIMPLFFIPIHAGAFIFLILYQYYYGMIDHSGIKMEAMWPWQPNTMFHDNHHKYFHTNFGFNLKFWDWLHDTLHLDHREYGENIFYGRGKQTEVKQS